MTELEEIRNELQAVRSALADSAGLLIRHSAMIEFLIKELGIGPEGIEIEFDSIDDARNH